MSDVEIRNVGGFDLWSHRRSLRRLRFWAGRSLRLRAGIHADEIELRPDGDICDTAVHLASRVEGQAQPGEVLVSRTVTDLTTGSDIVVESRGEHQLKGIAGTWELFTTRS